SVAFRLPGGSVFGRFRDRCAGLFFSYSYPFGILTPTPQSGFARPSLASTTPLWLFSSLTWRQQDPEADEAVPDARVDAAVRRPADPGGAAPVTAADHAGRARNSPLRIDHAPGGIRPIPVLTPLPHVPNHVIQSPPVRGIAPNRGGCPKVDSVRIIDLAHRGIVFVEAIEVRLSRV